MAEKRNLLRTTKALKTGVIYSYIHRCLKTYVGSIHLYYVFTYEKLEIWFDLLLLIVCFRKAFLVVIFDLSKLF